MRRFGMAALLALAACHRQGAADVTLDADADARNATAAHTLADLAAADAATRAPLPAEPAHHVARPAPAPAPAAGDAADLNQAEPATDLNDTDGAH